MNGSNKLSEQVVSSWFGGIWPGILASLLSTLALDYYFIPPIDTLTIGPKYMPNVIAFVASALFISWLNGKQKRANADLVQENRDRRKAEEALRGGKWPVNPVRGDIHPAYCCSILKQSTTTEVEPIEIPMESLLGFLSTLE